MARLARNQLQIRPFASDGWQLHGYVLGRRINLRSPDLAALESKRDELLRPVSVRRDSAVMRHTWLSAAQLRDAEAATQRANGVGLLECVLAAERVLVTGAPKPCSEARDEWLKALAARHRYPRTLEKNRHRLDAFLRASTPSTLRDITPELIDLHVLNPAWAVSTQVTTGAVLRAWLNFCVKRRWLRESPFQLDLADLAAHASNAAHARILKPDECHALLRAALGYAGGALVPYAVLSLWCFMRSAEVQRTTGSQIRLDVREPFVEVLPRKRGTVSYRSVAIPANVAPILREHPVEAGKTVFFSRVQWDAVRERAGLLVRLKATRNKRRKHADSQWQPNLMRHTGMSYLYQQTGDIREVCRQAGNSDDTAFRHYLRLPAEGDAAKFYAAGA